MALQPRATLSAKGNGFITGKSLPHSLLGMPIRRFQLTE